MNFEPARATERQRDVLLKILPDRSYEEIKNMTVAEASRHIAEHSRVRVNWRGYSPTYYQERFLRSWSQWNDDLDRGEASDRIAKIKEQTDHLTPEEASQERDFARRQAAASANSGGMMPN